MHRSGAVDFVTLRTRARAQAEQADQPSCRTDLGLRIKPLGTERVGAAGLGHHFVQVASPLVRIGITAKIVDEEHRVREIGKTKSRITVDKPGIDRRVKGETVCSQMYECPAW